jgi:acetate---CoA ligase (ADP-forming)
MEAEVATRDGSLVHIRPVRPADADGLQAFLEALPPEDRYLRFFSFGNNLARTARDETNVDYVTSLGLLATAGPDQRIVGHGLYVPGGHQCAEVAFAIARDYQGHGLATILLGQLAEAARRNGIQMFEAVVLGENQRMLRVFRESGFPVKTQLDGTTVRVLFPTSLSPDALARFDQREETAASNALQRFLYPRSVAVIGASRNPSAVGGAVLRNLISGGFCGPIYPINPAATIIQSITAYASVERTPGPVDLAVIAVPADKVVQAAEECGRKGVAALVVLSAGFAELGDVGKRREAELLRVCAEHGMRLIGPNCIGIINTDPQTPLNATFGPLMPSPGRIGLATQSGAIALAAIDFAGVRDPGAGFSSVVSMGNKADISGNDLLGYWHTDPRTDVILLYLESFGNPRKFARLARVIGRTKPIVALKSGRSAVGARATASHTGALLAASDVTVDALFRQAGVIRTDTLDEMLDVARLLVHQPLPCGPRVAILTNVGGPAVMCADTCEAHGLQLPTLSPATQAELRKILPIEASVLNPVDMLASASADQYREAVELVAADSGVDAVISIFLPPLATRPQDVADALKMANVDKPVLGVFMSSGALPDLGTPDGRTVPGYHMPEPAAIALAHAVRYAEWRARPSVAPPILPGIQHEQATELLAAAVLRGAGWLTPDEVRQLLGLYGVPVVEQRIVSTPAEAGAAAAELGGEVALKAVMPGLVHKSDVGGVRLHLATPREVELAAMGMEAALLSTRNMKPTGYVVQRMADAGVEMLVGVVNDSRFGPTIACGAGGTLVELVKDVAVRLTPLTPADAATMLRDLRSFPLLNGYRGSEPADIPALEDVLLRVAALADDHPVVAELDCNPVIVSRSGALVVDARIRVQEVSPPRPLGARR